MVGGGAPWTGMSGMRQVIWTRITIYILSASISGAAPAMSGMRLLNNNESGQTDERRPAPSPLTAAAGSASRERCTAFGRRFPQKKTATHPRRGSPPDCSMSVLQTAYSHQTQTHRKFVPQARAHLCSADCEGSLSALRLLIRLIPQEL